MITCPSGWHDSKFHTSYYFNRASLVADPRFPCGRNESSFRRPLVHSASSVDLTKGKPWESCLIILFIISWDSRAERSGVMLNVLQSYNNVKRRGLSRLSECTWLFRNSQDTHERLAIFFFLFLFFPFFFRENIFTLLPTSTA